MTFLQIAGVGLVICAFAVMLRSYRSEYALFVAIAGGEAWLVKAKSDYKPAARQTTTTAAGEGKKNAAKPQSRVQQRIAELEAAHQKTE